MVEVMARISSMPAFFRCSPMVINCRTFRNFAKSIRFFDFSGCCSKKGTIRSFRWSKLRTRYAILSAVVRANHTAPKKLLECMQKLDVSLVLYNCEFREHLKTGSHLRVRIDAHEEATFAVNKSDHPLRFQPPRLWLNVKSLRVLHVWSLPCGLSPCLPDFDYRHLRRLVPDSCMRSFPHIVQFY